GHDDHGYLCRSCRCGGNGAVSCRVSTAEHAHLWVTELRRTKLVICCLTIAWRVPGYERCAGVFTSRVCARDLRCRRNLALTEDAGAYTICVIPRTRTTAVPAAASPVAN